MRRRNVASSARKNQFLERTDPNPVVRLRVNVIEELVKR